MPNRKLTYGEGDWFGVPLREGGFALGVVARMDGRGAVVGYFFGPPVEELPDVHDLDRRRPRDALTIRQFGDLRLLKGQWPVIGKSRGWSRDLWPLPAFGRVDELGGRAWRVEYSDDDLNRPASETPIPLDEAEALPRNGILGAAAVEMVLASLLKPGG